MDSEMHDLGLSSSSPGSTPSVPSHMHQSPHRKEDIERPTPNKPGSLTIRRARPQSSSSVYAVGQAAEPSLALCSRLFSGEGGRVPRSTNSRTPNVVLGSLGVPENTLPSSWRPLSSPGHLMGSSSLSAGGAASPSGQDQQVAALASGSETAHQILQQQNGQAYGMGWDLVSTFLPPLSGSSPSSASANRDT
jgi:hypothetical protein